MNSLELENFRAEIDALDLKLVQLLNQRARLALDIAEIKKQTQDTSSFYRPEREARVLNRVKNLNKGPLSDAEITRLVREVMSACLALEAPLTIACLGPEGTFTQSAALKHFGQSVELSLSGSIDQVFHEVEAGVCQYGVVPVENSVEGAVNQTLDMLLVSDLKLCGEVELCIHQHLLSHSENLGDIEMVYSHAQSLAQCRRWLDANLSEAQRISMPSNAQAALYAERNEHSAAVAGERAAMIYQLPILRKNIENDPANTTRFLVLGRDAVAPSGNDKTSILFAMPSTPGALMNMLACFSNHNVNMTKIESRPSRQGMWEYVFFVDIIGHADDEEVVKALSDLRGKATMLKLLGSYPAADC